MGNLPSERNRQVADKNESFEQSVRAWRKATLFGRVEKDVKRA